VLIDIYSRFNPSWIVSPVEDSLLATDFIAEAIERNGATPHTVHADRGTSMTSKPVSALLADLGVTRSHSRPRVSNDNPFSEAQFKTLKYLPDFPTSFTSLAHARQFCAGFFHEYNYIHRRSGIAWHTPASVHFGTASTIDQERQNTLTAAYHAHPERFGRRPHPPLSRSRANRSISSGCAAGGEPRSSWRHWLITDSMRSRSSSASNSRNNRSTMSA
jgi:putative transposase